MFSYQSSEHNKVGMTTSGEQFSQNMTTFLTSSFKVRTYSSDIHCLKGMIFVPKFKRKAQSNQIKVKVKLNNAFKKNPTFLIQAKCLINNSACMKVRGIYKGIGCTLLFSSSSISRNGQRKTCVN